MRYHEARPCTVPPKLELWVGIVPPCSPMIYATAHRPSHDIMAIPTWSAQYVPIL